MRNIILAILVFNLAACATNVPQNNIYSYDIYQYKLNESNLNLVQKNLNDNKISSQDNRLTVSTNSVREYTNFINKMEKESFFSEYKYSYVSCKIIESTILVTNNNQQCKYEYNDAGLNLDLIMTKIEKNEVSYTISAANTPSTMGHNNINDEYLMFTFKNESMGGLFFIINKNWLNKPWSFYAKTPHAENH